MFRTGRTVRAMKCEMFVARHSEFVDDRLRPSEAARMRAHLDRCASCARHHDAIVRSRRLVRELPCIEPSSDFYLRLRERLAEEERAPGADREPVAPQPVRSAGPSPLAMLSIAGILAVIALSPLLRSEAPTARVAPFEARAPQRVESTDAPRRRIVRWRPTGRIGLQRTAGGPPTPLFRRVRLAPEGGAPLYSPLTIQSPVMPAVDPSGGRGIGVSTRD